MMRLTSNTRRWVLASLAAAALYANSAMAQSAYPNRPLLMVVPQAAGGTNDIVGRIVSQKLGEVLNTAVVLAYTLRWPRKPPPYSCKSPRICSTW